MSDTRKEFEEWARNDGQLYEAEILEGGRALKTWQACQTLNDKRIAKLEAELEQARKDAERWQYFVDYGLPYMNVGQTPKEVIDEAINQAKEPVCLDTKQE